MDKTYIGIGINRGVFVPDEEALGYIAQHLQELSEAEQKDLIEWFFSGSFVYRSEE